MAMAPARDLPARSPTTPGTGIGEFRWLYLANLGIAGFFSLLLYFWPGGIPLYAPWIIPNPPSATLIGAAYVGASLYYIAVLRENDWRQARLGTGGLVAFSLWLLVATMFDWDRFRPYHPTTLLWLVLYYLPPLGYPILYRLQRARVGEGGPPGPPISAAWRAWLLGRGMVYGVVAVVGLIVAAPFVGGWPWPLTDLEVRVFMGQVAINAWLVVPMLFGARAWRDHRLELVRIAGMGGGQLLGLALALADGAYNFAAPLGVVLLLVFLEWVLTPAALYLAYRRA